MRNENFKRPLEVLKDHECKLLMHIDEFKALDNVGLKRIAGSVSLNPDWFKSSNVYRLIRSTNSFRCACCETEAKYFAFAYQKGSQHVTPFFITECQKSGKRSFLTFDHVIPKSLGGSGAQTNGKVLCQLCNRDKSNNFTLTEMLSVSQCDDFLEMIGFTDNRGVISTAISNSLQAGPIKITGHDVKFVC